VSDVPSASIPLTVTTAESVIPLTLDIVQHETVTVEVLPKPKNPSSATTSSVMSASRSNEVSTASSPTSKNEKECATNTSLERDNNTKFFEKKPTQSPKTHDSHISSEKNATEVECPSELPSKGVSIASRRTKKRRSHSNDVDDAMRTSSSASSFSMTQKTAKHQRDIQRKSATISLEGEGVVGAAIASSKKSSRAKVPKEKKSSLKTRDNGKNSHRSHIRHLKTRAEEMNLESLQREMEDTSESGDDESDELQQVNKQKTQTEDKKNARDDSEATQLSNSKQKGRITSLELPLSKKENHRQRPVSMNLSAQEKERPDVPPKPLPKPSSLRKKRTSARPEVVSVYRTAASSEWTPNERDKSSSEQKHVEVEQQQQQQQPRLRKWFKHKEELSGPFKGPRTSLTPNSVEEIEKALQSVLHTRRGDTNDAEEKNSRGRRSELGAVQHSTMSSTKLGSDNKKQLATDNLLIREIILTERDYVYDLIVITEIFLKPLRQQKVIPNELIDKIFVNIEALLAVNRKLLQSLETYLPNPTPAQVASCFLDAMKDLKIYEEFCSKQREVFATIRQLKAENRNFDVFLEYCYLKRECRNLDINALLIKPVQRICKYPLLLQELSKQLKGTLEGEIVAKAHKEMENLVSSINEKKGALDNLARVQEVENELSKFTKEPYKLVKEGRVLVSEGELYLVNNFSHKKSRGYYYLFSDLFLYTTTKILRPSNQRKFTIKYELPLDSVVIVERDEHNVPNTFEIDYYANFFTRQTILFCTKHATDKETLISLLEEQINATLLHTYKKFVLIHSGQSGTNQISFEQWKNKKFPGSPAKTKKLVTVTNNDVVEILCEINDEIKTLQTTRQNLDLLALNKLLESSFGSPGSTLLLMYKDSKTGERIPIYTQEALNRAIAQSPSPKELHLILLNVDS